MLDHFKIPLQFVKSHEVKSTKCDGNIHSHITGTNNSTDSTMNLSRIKSIFDQIPNGKIENSDVSNKQTKKPKSQSKGDGNQSIADSDKCDPGRSSLANIFNNQSNKINNLSNNNVRKDSDSVGTSKQIQQQRQDISTKRPSISIPNGDFESIKKSTKKEEHCNNENNKTRSRDLSPTPRNTQRKLSQDIRDIRSRAGSYTNLDEDSRNLLMRKPTKLKNISSRAETFDTLYSKGRENLLCSKSACMGSIMGFSVLGVEVRKPDIVLDNAKDFLDQYFTSIRRFSSTSHDKRWKQVQQEVEKSGCYQLTETELIYGAKLAWRNSSRCIGRIQWSKLQVFDCRYVTTTSGMFEAICNHMKYATNKGNLRSAITIFPQRTDGKHDYRIWNAQLISYAGYRQPDGTVIGDPMNAEFTEVCIKLGWKGKGGAWDILPLVVSANGHDPDYFDYPPELIVEVPLVHPDYEWFAELGLRWYALPAVSSMLFDCGGIQFTCTAFSGWYMSTEIGCRNLCDVNRRNLLEVLALKMGLDTRTPTSLWKDRALVECNVAVLHSFQKRNVTIVDHHTASESFIKHFENESKLRNGCPADWIWIVPPLSSSITPVFHQEMALYYLKPSFEYQEPAWKVHIWKKCGRDQGKTRKPRKKFHFKQIARAVKFTSKLFGRALSKRIKATVLYATETGKSEQYGKQIGELLGHAFNAQVYCMSDYDISSIEHEALLIVIGSTFGNGDPPENGEQFAQDLYAIKIQESVEIIDGKSSSLLTSSKTFMRATSRQDSGKLLQHHVKTVDRLDSLRGSTSDTLTEETFGPLSNVRFAVFALGSSAYPNFCAFGNYVDNVLGELGGERLLKISHGDEMCGQEQSFRKWAPEVFKVACETFCLDPDENISNASMGDSLSESTVRFTHMQTTEPLEKLLSKYHNKSVYKYQIKRIPIDLQDQGRSTILVEIIAPGVNYEPGDHIGIFPENNKAIVDKLVNRLLKQPEEADEIVELQLLKEKQTPNGVLKSWIAHEKIPATTIRNLLTRFLDITTPPTRQLLTLLAQYCSSDEEKERIDILINDASAYEDWRHWRLPHLLDVLEEFPSCLVPPTLLLTRLPTLQPRFYSISSCLHKYPNEIHLTVGVVKFRSEDGKGAQRYGVCSNYLESLQMSDHVYVFHRTAHSFHLPEDSDRPVILIGPGTGIAPFRSFWQYYEMEKVRNPETDVAKVWLFFGCRLRSLDLFREEKEKLLEMKVLDRVFLALSREPGVPKTYVQDLAARESDDLYKLIVEEKCHIYVCGDVTMAEHVYQTIRKIIATKENKDESEVEKYMLSLRDESRYHEDIFGITLRTAEIHSKSRASARIRMASTPQNYQEEKSNFLTYFIKK